MINITSTNVTVQVSNLSTSLAFYTDILGFKVLQKYGNHYAQISAPDVVIGLHPTQGKLSGTDSISIGLTVDDFSAAKDTLESYSIHYEERKEAGGHFIHFKDPDSNSLFIIKPKI